MMLSQEESITIHRMKAIGIILMVMVHSSCPVPFLKQFVYMFHMPLFFFASGYCFSQKHFQKPLSFLFKKIKVIWLPYVKWTVIFLFLHNLFFICNIYSQHYGFNGCGSRLYNFSEYPGILWCLLRYMVGEDMLLGGYWFLNALFFGVMIFYISLYVLYRMLQSFHIYFCFILVITLLGLTALLNYFHFEIPYLVLQPRHFFASAFIAAGYAFKYAEVHRSNWKISVLFLLITFMSSFFCYMEIAPTFYEKTCLIPLYFCTAVIAIWAIFSLLYTFSENFSPFVDKVMLRIGKATLPILTWHFLSFKLVSLSIIFLYCLPIDMLAMHPTIGLYAEKGWWIMYFLVGIFVPLQMSRYKFLAE